MNYHFQYKNIQTELSYIFLLESNVLSKKEGIYGQNSFGNNVTTRASQEDLTIMNKWKVYILMALVLSGNDNEKKIHLNSIEILAKELRKATGEVTPIYTNILADMQKQARVKTFLHIFVSKKVKELIGY